MTHDLNERDKTVFFFSLEEESIAITTSTPMRPRDFHGQIVDEAAVNEQPSVELDRLEHQGYCGTCTDRLMQHSVSSTTVSPVSISVAISTKGHRQASEIEVRIQGSCQCSRGKQVHEFLARGETVRRNESALQEGEFQQMAAAGVFCSWVRNARAGCR